MFFDTHAHIAPWSHDAVQTIDQLVDDAEQKGLLGICITDHYEKDIFYSPGYEDVFDPVALFDELSRYRRFVLPGHSGTSVLIGAELGWLPHLNSHLENFVKSYPFDSIILSLHLIDGIDPYIDRRIFDDGLVTVYRRVVERMGDMVQSFQDFDILGHFDYISRYSGIQECKMKYDHAAEEFDRLFSLLIENKKSIEINSGTILRLQQLGYEGDQRFPDQRIIERYLEMGGELISLGSDTHQSGNAAKMFNEITKWLYQLGVKELAYFAERKLYKYEINEN